LLSKNNLYSTIFMRKIILESLQPHLKCKKNEVNKAVLLPGDTERADYIGSSIFKDSVNISKNREFHIYNGTFENNPLAVCSTGIGCMSAAVAMEELIHVGCKYYIRVGTCGAFSPEIHVGDIIIVTGAVRGDGASREYIPLEYPAVSDFQMVNALIQRAIAQKITYHTGIIRTHDAFYMESPFAFGDWKKRTNIWTQGNILGVENETSTLLVIGSLKKVRVCSILVVAGHLMTGKKGIKNELHKSIHVAITIAAGALVDIQKEKEIKL